MGDACQRVARDLACKMQRSKWFRVIDNLVGEYPLVTKATDQVAKIAERRCRKHPPHPTGKEQRRSAAQSTNPVVSDAAKRL